MEHKSKQMEFFNSEKKRVTESDAYVAAEIRTLLSKSKPASVLDVGCGEGVFTTIAADTSNGVYVVGGDLSKSTLLRAKVGTREKNVDLIVCDVENLPFLDGSFDCVIAVNILHHLLSLSPISEISRVIKHGGPFFVCDHAYLSNPLFYIFFKLATHLPHQFLKFREDVSPQYEVPHVFMYHFNHLMQAFDSMGFRLAYLKRDTLFFKPLISVIRAISHTFSLPLERFLYGESIRTLCGLDDKLKKYLYQFCYDFTICYFKEEN